MLLYEQILESFPGVAVWLGGGGGGGAHYFLPDVTDDGDPLKVCFAQASHIHSWQQGQGGAFPPSPLPPCQNLSPLGSYGSSL